MKVYKIIGSVQIVQTGSFLSLPLSGEEEGGEKNKMDDQRTNFGPLLGSVKKVNNFLNCKYSHTRTFPRVVEI